MKGRERKMIKDAKQIEWKGKDRKREERGREGWEGIYRMKE